MFSFTLGTRSSSIFVRPAAMGLVVAGICGLLASDASANCSKFSTMASRFSAARRFASTPSGAPLITAADLKEQGNDAAITGLWQTAVRDADGVVIDQAFETFTSDGNELMVDTTPPALDNVCNGVWANFGHRKYRIKHPSWLFDPADGATLIGTAVIRTDLVLSRSGNQFTGYVTIFIYDLDGNLVDTTPTFDLKGTRITVD